MGLFKRTQRTPAPDPVTVALDATISDLRRLGSELNQTKQRLAEKAQELKENK